MHVTAVAAHGIVVELPADSEYSERRNKKLAEPNTKPALA